MKMRLVVLILLFFFSSVTFAFASSDYVLPYPSFMPGNKIYKVYELKDQLMKYWYFGSLGQFTFHLEQADKYLVEAKTLFEYNQYLLGINSLQKSNQHFEQLSYYLENAKKEQKDISEKKKILQSAAQKHIEVLQKLKTELPENFTWRPEKAASTELNLQDAINESIAMRGKVL
jgi:hypothetical protein